MTVEELEQAGELIDELVAKLEAHTGWTRTEAMSFAVGTLAAGLVHDARTPRSLADACHRLMVDAIAASELMMKGKSQ